MQVRTLSTILILTTVIAGCFDSEGSSGDGDAGADDGAVSRDGERGDGGAAEPGRDGGADGDASTGPTVNEVVRELDQREEEFASAFCGCGPFLETLEEFAGRSFTEEECVAALSTSDEVWTCLRENVGSEPADTVRGLRCELEVRTEAVSCVEPLTCTEEDSSKAMDCLESMEEGLEMCDFGSGGSGDPSVECFE